MEIASKPANETARLKALQDYDILDTTTEQAFDDLAKLASEICGTPIALVSLVDENRQWFKSHHGLDVTETPRDVAFCAHAILQDGIFEVTDADADPRFHDNPLVTGKPDVRFYAGAVLKSADEHNIGTLCVIDHEPRQLDDRQRNCLRAISRQVQALLEMRRTLREKERLYDEHTRDRQWIRKRREELARFAYRSSHDLRAPAIQINELARLTQEDIDTGRTASVMRNLDMLQDASERLLAYIDGVVDLGRAELVGETRQVIDFERLVREAIAQANSMLPAHGVTIRSDIQVSGHHLSEFLRLRHILTQLLSNSIRFANPDRPKCWVDIRVVESEDGVTIEVADNGLGIPAPLHSQYFDMFRRFHPEVCPGSGVGTAIVQKHANALGASISLESDSRGTTVRIGLPPAVARELACSA